MGSALVQRMTSHWFGAQPFSEWKITYSAKIKMMSFIKKCQQLIQYCNWVHSDPFSNKKNQPDDLIIQMHDIDLIYPKPKFFSAVVKTFIIWWMLIDLFTPTHLTDNPLNIHDILHINKIPHSHFSMPSHKLNQSRQWKPILVHETNPVPTRTQLTGN